MRLNSSRAGAATVRIVVLAVAIGVATRAQAQSSTSLPLAVGLDDAACARDGRGACDRDRDGTPSHVLPAAIISGAIGATIGYVFGVGIASAQPRSSRVDALPVVGALVAAGRNGLNDPASSMLLVSAGVQMMGLLVTAVAGAELAAKARPRFGIAVVPGGGTASASFRF